MHNPLQSKRSAKDSVLHETASAELHGIERIKFTFAAVSHSTEKQERRMKNRAILITEYDMERLQLLIKLQEGKVF